MGQKTCNGSCIAASACCTDTDCGSGKKCSSGSCIDKTCEEMGQKTCNGSCIAASACCTDTDCGSGKKCSSGSCIDKTCEEMGQKNCEGKCIAKTACCVSGDCASGMKCFDNICIAQTCEDKGLKTCNGSCIAVSECCGGCQPNETCKNGVCVNNETCLSQIMSSGNYAQDANGVIYSKSAPNTAYVIADGAMPFKNPGIAETVKDYRYVYGPSKLAQFSKCAALPVPTLTATSTGFESAEWILNKSLDGVNVKLAGSASYYIDATVVWDNVKFLSSGSGTVEINSPGNVTLGLNADFGTNNGLQYNIRDGAKMTVKGPASGTPVHKAKLLAVWTTAKLTTSGNIDFGTLDNSGTSNSIQAGEYKGEVIVRRGSLTFGSGVKHTGGTVAVYTDAKFYGSGATLNKVAADGYISLSNTTVSDSVSVNFSGGGETANSNGEAYLNNVTTPKLTIDGGIARLYSSGVNTVYVKPWGALHIISNANVNALVLNDYSSTNKVPANLFLYQNARLDVYSLKMNQSAKIRMNYGSYLQVQYMDMCYQNTDGWRTQICYYGVPSGGSVAQINYRGTITKGTTGGRNTRATKNSCIINPGFGTSNSDDNNYWECDWDNSSKGNWYFDTMKNKYRCCK